jgi:hypothetical protein
VLRQEASSDEAGAAGAATAGSPANLEEYRRRKKVG